MAHLLIVDDERDTLQLLRLLMEGEGHTVVLAANGWEALRRLGEAQFDLILLDILMPGLDGPKFLSILRRTIQDEGVPVVVVTALDRDEAADRVIGSRVDGVVVKKPAEMIDDLLAKVRGLVGRGEKGRGEDPRGEGTAN